MVDRPQLASIKDWSEDTITVRLSGVRMDMVVEERARGYAASNIDPEVEVESVEESPFSEGVFRDYNVVFRRLDGD